MSGGREVGRQYSVAGSRKTQGRSDGSGEKIEEEEVAHGLARIFTEAVDLLSFAAQFSRQII